MIRFIPLIVAVLYMAVNFICRINDIPINSLTNVALVVILLLPYLFGVFHVTIQAWIGFIILTILLAIPNLFFWVAGDSLFLGSGLISLILFGIAFSGYLSHCPEKCINIIIKSINTIFFINIIYILIETLVLIFGGFDMLDSHIKTYRHIPGQPIYSILGIESPGSPLGLQIQPQYASQILILGMFWFLPIVKFPDKGVSPRNGFDTKKIWFIMCIFLYPFCMTGTSVLMGLGMLLTTLLLAVDAVVYDWIKKNRLFLSISIGLFILVYGWSLPLYRVRAPGKFDFYLEVFLDPIKNYFDLSFRQIFFGMKGDVSLISYTDFGYGAILWNSGALLLIIFISLITFILMKLVFILTKSYKPTPFLGVHFLLIIQIIGWLLSLSHYTIAIESIGKIFFSLIIGSSFALFYLNDITRMSVCRR